MAIKVTKPQINLREKLSSLDTPSGVAGNAMLRAETPQEQFNLIGAGRRNLALNGNFNVSQRGDFTIAYPVVHNDYVLDRWRTDIGSVAGSVQQIPSGFAVGNNSMRILATSSATGYMGFVHRWNYDELPELFSDTQDNYVVYSGWVKTNSAHFGLYVYNGGSKGRVKHSGSGEWEFISTSIPTSTLDSGSTADFNTFLYNNGTVPIATGDYLELSQMQIEINKTGVATPFEHRSYGEELALCQRYFEKGNLNFREQSYTAGVWSTAYVNYKVTKRSPVTFDHTVGVSSGWSLVANHQGFTDSYQLRLQSSSAAQNGYYYFSWTADAEL